MRIEEKLFVLNFEKIRLCLYIYIYIYIHTYIHTHINTHTDIQS